MEKSRNFYVYVHRDNKGNIFYVGMGSGKRAWSKNRHVVWHRYVEDRLGGEFQVDIILNNLTEEEAIDNENALIAQFGPHLVNWSNCGRQIDSVENERFHSLRNANQVFVQETRSFESTDPEEAVRRYLQALEKMREYESIAIERGLIAELMEDDKAGDPVILDRLTLCLVRLGRDHDAKAEAERYFKEFPGALKRSLGQRVLRRVERLA